MELTLRDRKRIKNGAVPKFQDGNVPAENAPGYLDNSGTTTYVGYVPQWQPIPQFYGGSAKSIFDPTNLGVEMPTTKDLGVPSGQTNIPLKATPDQKEMITGDTSKGHNFDNGLQSVKTAGAPLAYDKYAGAALATIGAIGDIADAHSYSKSSEQLLDEGGRRMANAAGQGYVWQNDPEYQRELEEVRKSNTANTLKATGSGAAAGAAIGSIVPGLGTLAGGAIGGVVGAIGGLFGGASRKRKAEEKLKQAEINAKVRNDFARDDALTRAIRQRNAEEIGNPFANAYKYEDGRSPANAMVSNGETILNEDGSRFKVGTGKDNKDTVPIRLRDGQGVITNKYGLSDMAMYNPGLALTLQTMLKQNGMLKGYKNGKLPGFKGGLSPWTNIIPSTFGGIASIYQYFDAKNQSIKSPNVYASNPYAQDAFAAMNEIKNNPYPTLSQLREAEARTRYALDSSGGLGSGQKMLARIAQQGLTQNAWAKSLADTQAYNNAQKMAVQNAKLQTGYQDATRKQQSNIFNEEYTAKSHAARQQGMQMGIYNFKNMLDNYYANRFKEYQLGETLGLYKQNLDLDREKFEKDFGKYANYGNNTSNVMNVLSNYNRMLTALGYR